MQRNLTAAYQITQQIFFSGSFSSTKNVIKKTTSQNINLFASLFINCSKNPIETLPSLCFIKIQIEVMSFLISQIWF